jgi:HNH endonuclease
MRKSISEKVRLLVAQRASYCCEYCHVHQDYQFLAFEIDHIISIKHGSGNEISNLAYACPHCNQYKGSDLTTILDSYDDIVVLFNPRKHIWNEHFETQKGEILPKSRIGQASIKIFKFNEPDRLILRQTLAYIGLYP